MVIWSEFRIEQLRDDDYREDAPHFKYDFNMTLLFKNF